ncbi:MAG: hypothetical protein IJ062_11070 [Firmicutes bacterium]|nr:hypothetical protein [Bacillota bacterium]
MIKTYPAEKNINSDELYNKQSQNTQGILIKEDAESMAKKYLENFFEVDLTDYMCTSTYNRDEYGIVMEMWSVMFEKDEKVYFADIDPYNGKILSLDVYDTEINKNSKPTESISEEELETKFRLPSEQAARSMQNDRQPAAYRQYTRQPKGESVVTLFKFAQGDGCEVELSYPSGQKIGYKYYKDRQTMNFQTKDSIKTMLKRRGYQCYWVSVRDMPTENVLSSLKEINGVLNQKFDFIELCTQPVEYVGNYSGDVSFVDGGAENVNRSDGVNYYTMLKTVQIGRSLCEDMRIPLAEGKYIERWDYYLKNGDDTVNAILGYDYKPYYSVGDEIEVDYLRKNIKLKVVGFYEKGAELYYGGRISLDKYIVMPFVNCEYEPKNEEEKSFQTNLYWQKNDGLIRVNDDFDLDAAKAVTGELSKKYNTEITILDSDMTDIDVN